jgi:tetratricopeptide (TPR) repeat protein
LEASKIKPSDCEALCNWGSVLFERAKRSAGEAAIGLFEQAAEKYLAAHSIRPNDHELLYNWAFLLSELSERVTGDEVALQVMAAIAKYREALAVKPGDQETLFYLTRMLLKGAKRAQGEYSKQLNAEAREKMRALKVGAMGPYNLACLAALDVNEELCRKYLQMAEAAGTLPDSGYLAADADLDPIRNTQWFQQLLERKPASEKT